MGRARRCCDEGELVLLLCSLQTLFAAQVEPD